MPKSNQAKSNQKIQLRVLFFIILQKDFPEIIEELKGKPLYYYERILDGDEPAEIDFHNSLSQWAIKNGLTSFHKTNDIPINEVLDKRKVEIRGQKKQAVVKKDGTKVYDKEPVIAQWCPDFAEQYIDAVVLGNFKPEQGYSMIPKVPLQVTPSLLLVEGFIEQNRLEPPELISDLRQVIAKHCKFPDDWEAVENEPNLQRVLEDTAKALIEKTYPANDTAESKAVRRMLKRLGLYKLRGRFRADSRE